MKARWNRDAIVMSAHYDGAYYAGRVVRASSLAPFPFTLTHRSLVTSLKRCVIPSNVLDFSNANRVTLLAFAERDQHFYGRIPRSFFSPLARWAPRLVDSEILREKKSRKRKGAVVSIFLLRGEFLALFYSALFH